MNFIIVFIYLLFKKSVWLVLKLKNVYYTIFTTFFFFFKEKETTSF